MSDLTPSPTGRRQFLRLGGTGVVAAAVLAACGSDKSAPPSESGVTEPVTETTLAPPQTTAPDDGAANDAAMVRNARSVELALAEAYGLLLASGVALDDNARASLTEVQDRHTSHAESLVGIISANGGSPVNEPNNGVLTGIVEPALPSATTERAVVQLARGLELLAAGTYAWGAGTLTVPERRAELAAFAGATARHGAALSLLLDPSGGSAVEGATFDSSGPARLPDHMLLIDPKADGDSTLSEPAAAAEEEGDGATDEESEDDDGAETPDAESTDGEG